MRITKQLVGIAGILLISDVALADFTANVAATNNYIWRGVTQTNDRPAVSGGADYSHVSGLYVGGWLSNVDFGSDTTNDSGTEIDVYGGYAFDVGPVGLDVGVITYNFPSQQNSDVIEVFGIASYNKFGLGAYVTIDKDSTSDDGDIYIFATAEFELANDFTLGLTIGDYDIDAAGSEDYTHYQVAVSKGNLTFALDQNDMNASDANSDADDTRFTLTYTKEFDWSK